MGLISFFRKWCHLVVSEATTADPFRFGRLKKNPLSDTNVPQAKETPYILYKTKFYSLN